MDDGIDPFGSNVPQKDLAAPVDWETPEWWQQMRDRYERHDSDRQTSG